jgi:hypothetical protein
MGKNFTKKLLPLALTAAMIVPSVPAMAAPSDIAGHWAESVITQWQSKGLIQGYEDGTFKPGNTITRAEFVTLMNNAKGFWSEGSINFSDVKNGSWFYSAVARAVAAGYVKGYSDDSFKPGNTITRAEAAVMIANAARLSANEAGAYRFTDVGSIPAWARGSVGAVVAAGYMTGYPDGSFDANASISRAEAVSSLNRMLGGTAYQPTQPTTPTTDTTKTTSDDVVIENKGTTLKNQTVDGNVTIAKSVGNGDVTLRNVTIKGDLIVKGGGSNTVTLEDVDVRGKVRLLKEGVHLHLVGDTDIRKLLIDLAARITQSSSYKDEIGEIILAGDGDLSKTTRIDVPAKQLRIENQADLILGGDVEKLIVDEDAKGAEIEIKKGTTVNELNTDAKIKLTGKGRIDLLDVSASGVTFDKNLDIRKKDTSNGATAPKENGSTSTGGSSTTSKEITGAEEVTLNVPYGEKTADQALAAIPKTVTLNLKNGKTISATVTEWKWADGEEAKYNATPTADTTYKATTTVTIPSGYTYNGTLTAKACVTVHPLDKTELTAALTAANAVFNNTTTDEKVAATDKEKILITDKAANAVTEGVRFTTSVAKNTLETAISNARDAENTGFASQKACKAAADALQVAITAFKGTIKIGTNTTTDAYILQQVKDVVSEDRNSDAPYSSYKQPLKFGYVYKFVDQFNFDNTSLHFAWEAQWKNQSETGNIGDYIEIGKDVRGTNAFYSLGAKVIKAPDEPKEVQFVVTVTDFYNKEIGKLGENGEYSATIGAPISATLPSGAPQFKAISDGTPSSTGATKFTGVVPITLNGANAITSVPNNCVTMANSNTESNAGEVSFRTITVDKVEKSGDVLNVTVSVTTGAIGGVWSENSPYPFKKGTLPNISINTSGFVLKTQEEGNPGWYLPTDNTLKLGDDMTVDVLTPAFTGVEHADDSATFTIQTQNMPKNATVEVALAKTSVTTTTDIDNAKIKKDATRGENGKYSVTFDKSVFEPNTEYYLWFRYGAPGSDWAYENVTSRPTYTFNNTTGGNTGSESEGGGDASGSTGGGNEGGGSTTEGN